MKRSFYLILFILAIPFSRMRAQDESTAPDLLEFYHTADSIAHYPLSEDSLKIMGSKLIDKNYVTFLGYKTERRVRIAVVTTAPFKNVKDISLIVRFQGVKPYTGKITTWGYVFDRNGDGKVDYLELLGGAAAFLADDVPADFPDAGKHLNQDQMEIFASHCNLIFNHWADDDFNGKLDAVVQTDMDPKKAWVNREIFARSVRFNGKLDEAWSFRGDPAAPHGAIKIRNNSIVYSQAGGGTALIDKDAFEEHTNVLTLINRAVKLCGFKADDFSLEPADSGD
jgi:hypothetical protein